MSAVLAAVIVFALGLMAGWCGHDALMWWESVGRYRRWRDLSADESNRTSLSNEASVTGSPSGEDR